MPQNLSYAKGPSQPEVRDLTLSALLSEAAAEVPDRVALIEGVPSSAAGRQWTYAELDAEADRVARALLTRFEPGERLAVWAPNIPEWIITEFGCARAGLILVTVNPAYQASELAYVLKQSKAAGLLLVPEYRGNPMLATAESVVEDCSDLREVIRFDEWDAFLASGDAFDGRFPEVKASDPVMIQYTSGTTGFPKGALLHHRGLVNNGAHTLGEMQTPMGSTYITMMPLFHTGGCVICVLGAVARRCTQVLVGFDPELVLDLLERHNVESLLGVPTMLVGLLEHPDFPKRNLEKLSSVCSGGSTVPAPLVKRFEEELGASFTIVFGQTECSPVASMTRPADSAEDKAGTLGGPMPNVEVKVVDPESGETVPHGALGEYCTRGYHVMHEYFEMPEATAQAIDAEGWLHTGDLCSMDARGYTKIEGRLKDMIIRGGENIYPREIEELLFQHASVGEVAVVGLPDDRFGEVVSAFLRPAPDATIAKGELRAYLRKHLSPQKTPALWFVIDEFPLTGSGKIQKFELRKRWEAGAYEETR